MISRCQHVSLTAAPKKVAGTHQAYKTSSCSLGSGRAAPCRLLLIWGSQVDDCNANFDLMRVGNASPTGIIWHSCAGDWVGRRWKCATDHVTCNLTCDTFNGNYHARDGDGVGWGWGGVADHVTCEISMWYTQWKLTCPRWINMARDEDGVRLWWGGVTDHVTCELSMWYSQRKLTCPRRGWGWVGVGRCYRSCNMWINMWYIQRKLTCPRRGWGWVGVGRCYRSCNMWI